MRNEELIALIGAHRGSSYGNEDGTLTNERAAALDHYNGRPYGDEEDGRSAVVSKDLKEVVDWLKPAIVKIFAQSGNIAEFVPTGEEDVETAKQESDIVNHVFMSENNGVLLLHDLVHDAALLKNAYCKHYIEEKETIKEEEYSGLTEDELAFLVQQLESRGEVKELSHEANLVTLDVEGQPVEIVLYDVRFRITEKEKKYLVEAVPAEEVRVSKKCKGSLQDSPFVEHVTTKTRTELIEMGMDADFVYSLPSHPDSDGNDATEDARDTVEGEEDAGTTFADASMDEIEYCEAHVRVDFDGDRKAELRKVITAGNRIPPGEEWNEVVESVNMTSLNLKRVPHRHIGESMDDDLCDLQQIMTVLKRNLLDNVYRTNSTEKAINERVNYEDALRHIAGNVIRVGGEDPIQDSVKYMAVSSIVQEIIPAIQMIEDDKQGRTGINDTNTDIDPNVLKEVNNKVFLEGVSKASAKIEMMARIFAEGIREIGLRVHELLVTHQDKEMTLQLRGEFVSVNPQEWKNRTDMRIKVGLGTGTEEEKRMNLSALSLEQDRMKEFGLVGPREAFNLFSEVAESLGEPSPNRYVMEPGSQEHQQFLQEAAQQEQSNPLAEAEMVKGQSAQQIEQMRTDFKLQVESAKLQNERQLAEFKAMLEQQTKDADLRSKEAIEIMKAEVQAFIAGLNLDIGKQGIGGEIG